MKGGVEELPHEYQDPGFFIRTLSCGTVFHPPVKQPSRENNTSSNRQQISESPPLKQRSTSDANMPVPPEAVQLCWPLTELREEFSHNKIGLSGAEINLTFTTSQNMAEKQCIFIRASGQLGWQDIHVCQCCSLL